MFYLWRLLPTLISIPVINNKPMRPSFNKIRLLAIIVFIVSSCKNNQDNAVTVLTTLDHSLRTSSQNIEISNRILYNALSSRASERKTMERAKPWLAKAIRIKSLSDDVYEYIEQFKRNISEEAGSVFGNENEGLVKDNRTAAIVIYNKNGEELLKKLNQYKMLVLEVDPELRKTFEKTIPIYFPGMNDKVAFKNNYFKNAIAISALATLSCFQNKVRNTENELINFCFERTSVVRIGPCCVGPQFISTLSSSAVKAGEKITVTAGIGTFSTDGDPVITIAGKKITLANNGSANYEFKAPGKPGKYMVPLEIKFINPDGTESTANKNIEYEVVKDAND